VSFAGDLAAVATVMAEAIVAFRKLAKMILEEMEVVALLTYPKPLLACRRNF
jgi:hypothetical protein